MVVGVFVAEPTEGRRQDLGAIKPLAIFGGGMGGPT